MRVNTNTPEHKPSALNRSRFESAPDTSHAQILNHINEWYDWRMFQRTKGPADYANYGYWNDATETHLEACKNLMEQLLATFPNREGRVLDVACGKGATTRYLAQYFPTWNITGINISEKQLQRARQNAPSCEFLLMDAVDLKFADSSFEKIISVEAAFHFDTREQFLKEAFRVLCPNGRIAISDMLATKDIETQARNRSPQNYLSGPQEYERLLSTIGFVDINVVDATEPCWLSFYDYSLNRIREKLWNNEINVKRFRRRMRIINRKLRRIRYYLLVSGRKPN